MTALHAGADVNAMNDAGETPLNRAAAGCHLAVTRTLLALGARVNTKAHDIKYKTMDGWTALISAAGDRHPECVQIVQALISAGADVNAGPKYGPSTPLLMAATEENVEAAKLLLAAGADVNAGPATPLALATAQSQPATHDRAAMEALLRQHGGHA